MITYKNIEKHIEGKKLILFGASYGAMQAINMLDGYCIAYICDNDKNKNGKKLLGIDIKSPESLLSEDKQNITIIISSMYYEEISYQLLQLGVLDILIHFALMEKAFNYQNDFVVGKGFHINITDFETMNKIAMLYSLLADDASRQYLEKILRMRMDRHEITWRDIKNNAFSGITPYFDIDLYSRKPEGIQIIIDGGAGDGGTLKTYYEVFGNRLNKIYAFEPAPLALKRLEFFCKYTHVIDFKDKRWKKVTDIFDIEIMPYALSDKDETCVIEDFEMGRIIDNTEANEYSANIQSKRIDDIIDINEKITMIKLDVEGGEMCALKGAENTIKKHNPILIICLYHRPGDLWDIPLYINTLCPDYKLYIRPHQNGMNFLELHAVI